MKNDIRKRRLKEGEIVPLSYNFHFVRVFGDEDNIDITEYFISDYYGIPLEDVVGNLKIKPRDLKQDSKNEKSKQVDLLLKLKDVTIDIEISTSNSIGKKERDLVYICKCHGINLKYSDNNYSKIGSSWLLRINGVSSKNDKLRRRYYMTSDDEYRTKYSEKLRIDELNLAISDDLEYNDDDEKIIRWSRILKASTREDMEKELGDKLMDKKTRAKLMREVDKHSSEDDVVELYTKLSPYEMEKNTEIIEAVEKATKEVAEKNAIEVAKRMLSDKLDLNLISKYTNLSIDEIKNIGK